MAVSIICKDTYLCPILKAIGRNKEKKCLPNEEYKMVIDEKE